MTRLWVILGGAMGGVARFWLSGLAAYAAGATFPIGALIVNVAGCFVIGFFPVLTVNAEAAIKAFLPTLDSMTAGGLVALEKVQALQYGADVKREPA